MKAEGLSMTIFCMEWYGSGNTPGTQAPSRNGVGTFLSQHQLSSSNQQGLQIQRPREHRQSAIRIHWPLVLRPIPIQLDAILIRIAQIQRLAHLMIRRAVERDACGFEPSQGISRIRTLRVEDRRVEKPGGARGGWLAAEAFPGVQTDVVMIAACVPKRSISMKPSTPQ